MSIDFVDILGMAEVAPFFEGATSAARITFEEDLDVFYVNANIDRT